MKVRRLDEIASWVGSRILRRDIARAVAPRTLPPPVHSLTLYDFEGSPWCRLVREYATILDLTLDIRPCPRETLLFGEGAFSSKSRFRPEAMKWYQTKYPTCDQLSFPLLVDKTTTHTTTHHPNNSNNNNNNVVVVVHESYDIISHLWQQYGSSVIPSNRKNHHRRRHRRPDQIYNSSVLPFTIRFLSLAGPSYLRPWPRCGVMRFPSSLPCTTTNITLYGSEGCPESRLVREVLCSLEIPYRSIPVAYGSFNQFPSIDNTTPTINDTHRVVLEVTTEDTIVHYVGPRESVNYLRRTYYYDDQKSSNNAIFRNTNHPTWLDPLPKENIGRQSTGDGTNSVAIGAYTAFMKGTRAFVPQQAMK